VALKGDCTVVAWGSHNHSGERSVPAGLSGVTQISVRGTHNSRCAPTARSPPEATTARPLRSGWATSSRSPAAATTISLWWRR